MFSVALAVSMHARIWATNFYSCIWKAKCSPMKYMIFVEKYTSLYKSQCTSAFCVDQRCMCTVLYHQSFMHMQAMLQAFSETMYVVAACLCGQN